MPPCPFFPDKAERKRFLEEVVEGQVSVNFTQLRTDEQRSISMAIALENEGSQVSADLR